MIVIDRLSAQTHIIYVDLAYTSRKSACNLTEFNYFSVRCHTEVTSFVNNTDNQMSAFHIRQGGNIRNDIILLFAVEVILHVLEFFPFTLIVFLWIFGKQILL